MTKLKIIKNLIVTIILVIIIDLFGSKVFKTKFSIYQNISIGIGAYVGCNLVTKNKKK